MTLSTLFLICFLVGLGVSAVSLFSSFLHLHHGGFHFHHHGGGGGHSLVKNSSELFGSLFNLAAITMFLAWFGGVGLLLETTRLAAGGVVVIAGGAGLTGAAAIVRIVRALRMREHPLQPIQLVGTIGKLTIPIREGGTGEIVYTVDGTRRCSGARSDDSQRPIARDTEVVITRYDKGIAYVCEFDRMIAR